MPLSSSSPSFVLFLFLCFVSPASAFQFTPIRTLVTSQALTSSLLQNINQEFITDNNVIQDIFEYHYHLQWDFIYTCIFGFTFYLQYNFNVNKTNWDDIELYILCRRRFNCFLMIMFIIFARNIQNAV